MEEEPASNPNSDETSSIKKNGENNSDQTDPATNSDQSTAETTPPQNNEPKELTAKEKDQLDFLAKIKADPANKKTQIQEQPQLDDNSTAEEDSLPAENNDDSQAETDNGATSHESSTEATPIIEESQNKEDESIVTVAETDDPLSQPPEESQPDPSDENVVEPTSNSADSDSANQAIDHSQQTQPETEAQQEVEEQHDEYDDDEDDEEELTEEEKAKKEKEAKLESYKQFVAEQKSKVEIDYAGIRIDIEANALPNRLYFIMNALSAIIASYGLVINSAAVVIGAMLVAMMLGPISGVALAIIDYRIPLLRKSLFTVLAGATMVVFIGFIVGFLHQDSPLTNEILSRTQPTSMDLMIALAGGTAGAYAMISPHLSVAVVGVAVATALVPPLAASGILFAYGEGSLGLGALLLALTNIIAIQFTNALVLWFSGFRRLIDDDYKSSPMMAFFRRNAVPLLLLVGIGGYLTYNFNTIRKKQMFENEVSESINSYFIDKGNALTATQFLPREDHQTVRAVMRGETRPTPGDAQYIEMKINQKIKEDYPKYQPVRLQLRYIPVVVIESSPNHSDDINKTDAAILTNE